MQSFASMLKMKRMTTSICRVLCTGEMEFGFAISRSTQLFSHLFSQQLDVAYISALQNN